MSWLFPLLLLLIAIASYFYWPYLTIFVGFIFLISLSGIRVVYQYEKGVKFTLGKYTGMLGPGLRYIIPIIERLEKLDLRVVTVDIPKQEVMTKDNVPVRINGVVYFKVRDPEAAILKIQDFHYAISQYSLTALRDVVGNEELDSVLTERDRIAKEIETILDKETDEWGLEVTAIKLQDIELPENMKRVMARQAEAEREKRAAIIKAQGEVTASKNLYTAAHTLSQSPGALHLRTLQTINDVSPDQSNTIIFAVPLEILRAFESVNNLLSKKKQ
jgi:regulator of protease activity HflC (stomatin/prohibitin superfamily)